jgi:hypothetical protein
MDPIARTPQNLGCRRRPLLVHLRIGSEGIIPSGWALAIVLGGLYAVQVTS